jgi:hypothetical protein
MKVGELLDKLQNLDPKLEILCYTEDAPFLAKKHLFRLLDIESVETSDAERCRTDDRVPTLKLGLSSNSEKLAFLNVTADF